MKIFMEQGGKVYELVDSESSRDCAFSGERGCPTCSIWRYGGGRCKGASALGRAFYFEGQKRTEAKVWRLLWESD